MCRIFAANHEPKNPVQSAVQFCSNISIYNDTRYLNLVEKDISEMSIYLQLCSTVATLISAPILGAWSDFHGRKKPFLAVCLAAWLCCIMSNTVVIDDSRKQLNKQFSGAYKNCSSFCYSISWFNRGTLVYSLFSIKIASTSEEHVRGYFRAYVIASACALLTFLYILFFLQETHNLRESEQARLTDRPDQLVHRPSVRHAHLYVLESFKVLLVPRPRWTRLCLILLITFMFIEFLSFDSTLTLLIFKRSPFNWDDQIFEKYVTLKSIASSVGVILVPLLFTLVRCVARESLMLILGIFANGLIAFYCTGSFFWWIVSRPANLVSQDGDQRADCSIVFTSLFSNGLLSVVSKTILYKLYELTWDSWPGFVFFVVAFLHAIVFFGQLLIHALMYPIWAAVPEIGSNEQIPTSSSDRLSSDTQDSVSVTVVNTSDTRNCLGRIK
uniref:Proton-coupled folate transporter n=1 Tax=Ditylenchus dipsaci TaxID=166011 RepID=A0A915D0V4_9BILA